MSLQNLQTDEKMINITKKITAEVGQFSSSDTPAKDVDLVGTLDTLKVLLKHEENRVRFSSGLCTDLITLIGILVEREDTDDSVLGCEVFRCLRNACAGCKKNQDVVHRTSECSELTVKYILIMKKLFHNTNQDKKKSLEVYLSGMKSAVQFLGNAVAGHTSNQEVVWNAVIHVLGELLAAGDDAFKNYVAMVIYNCLSAQRCMKLIEKDLSLIIAVISLFADTNSEWSWFIFERMLQISGFVEKVYDAMDNKQRLHLLSMVKSGLEEKVETVDTPEYSNIQFIVKDFLDNSHSILSLSQQRNAQAAEPFIVISELDILCTVSSHDQELQSRLQQESQLIPVLCNLLHCVNLIGQEGDNPFSGVNKVSEIAAVDRDHPGFGLKKDLIRLIGNMAYQHKQNQDKIRELGGLRMVLEHTNIDGRNPFITQWAVLAVRNLCEGNLDNQRFIAMLNLEGVTNNKELQDEFGITADTQEGNIIVKKVDM